MNKLKFIALLLVVFCVAAFLIYNRPSQKLGFAALTSSDTQNSERSIVNTHTWILNNFGTSTANTFTAANTFSAGWVISATSTGTKGIALTGGCFSLNGTCLPTMVGSSTLLSDANTWSALNLFAAASTTNLTASQSFFVAGKKVTGTHGFSSSLSTSTLWTSTSSVISAFGDSQSFVPNYSGNISSLYASTSLGTLGIVAITDQGSIYCNGTTVGATCSGSLNFTSGKPIVILGGTRTGSPTTTIWSLTTSEL